MLSTAMCLPALSPGNGGGWRNFEHQVVAKLIQLIGARGLF